MKPDDVLSREVLPIMLTTSYRLACEYDACTNEMRKLVRHFRKNQKDYGHDTPVPLATVLEVCGLNAAIWALRCVHPDQRAERDRVARLFAADCAASVLHLFERERPGDDRPRRAIETVRRFAFGQATREELASARAAAGDAAGDAAGAAARDAAWSAARDAAWSAARDAAGDAAWAAARDPARAAQAKLFLAWLEGRAEPLPLPPIPGELATPPMVASA
jgi:hypothetical protein